jgi:long-chain acyl-CoA synthetase
MDDDGYLYIVGRKKDVIIRGGNNIHAVDVEAVLYDHPDVLDAAVVGMPHKVLGEDVAAFVVLNAGASTSPEELRAHTAARLADYKVPRYIEIVAELPRNATGKVLKPELRARLGSSD